MLKKKKKKKERNIQDWASSEHVKPIPQKVHMWTCAQMPKEMLAVNFTFKIVYKDTKEFCMGKLV